MAYSKAFSLRLIEEQKMKLEIISKKSSRSLNKQIEYIVNNYIEDYEKINGKIEVEEQIWNPTPQLKAPMYKSARVTDTGN